VGKKSYAWLRMLEMRVACGEEGDGGGVAEGDGKE
jgi:hypothetical protein